MNTYKFIVTSAELLSYEPKPGEIVYVMDRDTLYTSNSTGCWMPLYHTHQNNLKKPHPRICEGCGAALASNKCEYCGSEY